MLSDLLAALSQQAVQAAVPKPVQVPCEPPHVYFLPAGHQRHAAAPKPREHSAADLSAIISFAEANPGASVFYNRGAVTLLCDDAERRDRIVLDLSLSPQLLEVKRWEDAGPRGVTFSQRELVLRLRTLFKRCLGPCEFLVESLRKVRLDAGGAVTGEVGKHKTSLSKQMLATVSGEVDLVDEFVLDVPIFDGILPHLRSQVTIVLDADAANTAEPFRLIPVAGDVEAALCQAEQSIGVMLGEALDGAAAGGRIYYGQA